MIETFVFYLFVMLAVMFSYQYRWRNYNWFAILILTFVLGLRGCGIDTIGYIRSFHFYCNMDYGLFDERYYSPYYNPMYESDPSMEWLHLVLLKIIKQFSNASYWYLLIEDFLTIFFFDRFIQRFKRVEKFWIIYFFFTTLIFTQLFNVMRQFLAFMVFLNIIPKIEKRKMKDYILLTLSLYAIHKSSIMLLPFYFFIHRDYLSSKYLQLGIYLIFSFFSVVFIDQLKIIMDSIFLVISGDVSFLNTHYLRSDEQELNISTNTAGIVFHLLCVLFMILNSDRFKKVYGTLGVIMYNFAFIGSLILKVQFNRGVERFNVYFISFMFIVLGLMIYQLFIINNRQNVQLKFFGIVVVLLHMAWFANSVFKAAAGCAPYMLNPEL